MKRIFTKHLSLALSFLLSAGIFSCEKNDPEPTDTGVDEALHLSFKAPDWERKIDCTHLDLPSFELNSQTYYTFASSASTKNTFFLSYPKDSSAMVATGNLKKYTVREFNDHDAPFQFSMKVPVTEGSSIVLVSQPGLTDDSYNEIVSIKHVGTAGQEAVFHVKGKYKMSTIEINGSGAAKPVSGTYSLKVKTTRK